MKVCKRHEYYELENNDCVVCSALWDAGTGCPQIFMDFIDEQNKRNEKIEADYKNGYYYCKGQYDAEFEKIKEENLQLSERIVSLLEMYKDISSVIAMLDEHRKKQIDENRSESRQIDELEERIKALETGKKADPFGDDEEEFAPCCPVCKQKKLELRSLEGKSYVTGCRCYGTLEP